MQHIEQSVFEFQEHELRVLASRSCDAPREELWRACTVPDLLQRWWGPRHLLLKEIEWDARVDSPWHFAAENAAGEIYESRGTFLEIDGGERLVLTLEVEKYIEQPLLVTAECIALPQEASRLSTMIQFPSIELFTKARDAHWDELISESFGRLADLIAR